MNRFIKSILFLFTLLLLSNANATIYYVNDNSTTGDVFTSAVGNNSNSGLTAALPKLTLSAVYALTVAGDTIKIDKGTFTETSFNFARSLTVIGAGPGNTVYNGGASVNRFATLSANNITIKNMTIRNYYYNSDGQVISMSGRTGIVLENLVIKDNQGNATSGVNIEILAASNVTVKNCLFSCSGWNSNGGGTILANASTVLVTGCIFKEVRNFADFGGAIEMQGATANVTVTNSTFDKCSSYQGGAIYQANGTLVVTGSCFQNNFTQGGSNSTYGGGAFSQVLGSSSFTNCSFNNNYTDKVTAFPSDGSTDGGAILLRAATCTFNLNTCSFSNSDVWDKGQDIYLDEGGGTGITGTITNCTFGSTIGASGSSKVSIYNVDLETGDFTLSFCGSPTYTGPVVFTGAGSNATAPTSVNTAVCSSSALAACGVAVNCATETNAPVIVSCVADKTLAGICIMPEYRPEVSAFDDCSFTIVQSPAAGTALVNGVTVVTMTLTDQAGNISTCTFNVTVTGCSTCVTPTNSGTDGSITVCSNGASVNLFSSLGGTPDATGTWSGTSTLTGGNLGTYDATTMTPGVYTYTVVGIAPCVTSTSTVTVTETTAPVAGTSASITLCANGSAVDLYSSLTGSPDITGSWSGTSVLTGGYLGTYNPVTASAGVYTYTVTAASCTNATAAVTVTESAVPVAGTSGSITLCSNGASVNLFSTLTGSPAATGTWTGASVLTGGNLGTYDPVTATAGVYTYTVSATSCTDATATVTVTETTAPVAGTSGVITLCSNGTAVNLFSTLTGSPASTGVWSGTSTLTGGNLGTYDPATMTAGVYTYTVSATSCTDATSTVTVTETTAPNAGTNGTVTICSVGASQNLFSQLGGSPDASGTWSGTSVLGGGNLGTYDPTTMTPGTYTYTVLATGGCLVNSTSTVDVTEVLTPDAGSVGSITVCSNGTSVNLYSSLGGSPNTSGTWSGGSVLTGAYLGTYDPVTMTPGVYTYTVSIAGCVPNASSTVTVTETTAPNAGTNATVTICSVGASQDLFSLLGGSPDATGTWSGISALTGGNLGTYDPTTMTPGTYTYTVLAVGGCLVNSTSTVVVTEVLTPNAGTVGSITVCSNGTAVDLFSSLGGTPNTSGTWSGTSVLTGAYLGTYDPVTMTPGVYTYTVIVPGCVPNASSTVTVTESTIPVAGTNGTVTVCSNASSIDLFSSLGGSPDITGSWSGLSVLAGAHLGTFDPLASLAGTYTYTSSATSCTNSTATVIVTVTTAPVAGTSGVITVCSNGSSVDLFSSLTGLPNTTGVWTGTSVLTGGYLGTYDPSTLLAGTYTYTVSAASCTNSTSTVVVTETTAPNAGVDGLVTVCSNGTSVDLFTSLTGSPDASGTWSGPSTLAGGNLGSYNPSTLTAGIYSYTVSATACSNDISTVTVTETTAPSAGTNGTITVCSNGASVDLFSSIIGTPDITGTWSGPSVLAGTHLGTYDPSTLTAGTYTYTVSAAACSNSTATVVVTETTLPDAGTNGVITVCSNGSSVDLFSSLVGSPDITGLWTGPSVLTGGYLGTYNPSVLTAGAYTYTVFAVACSDAIATVIVTETTAPDAGSNGAITVCSDGASVDLFSSLAGTPDMTGTWTGVSVLTGGYLGTYDPSTLTEGTYTYTISAVSCTDVSSIVSVTESVSTVPVIDQVIQPTCLIALGSIEFSGLPSIGNWTITSTPAGYSSNGSGPITTDTIFNVSAGSYTFTVTNSDGCISSASGNVVVGAQPITPPAPSGDLVQEYCLTSISTIADLVTSTGINIQWYDAYPGGNLLNPSTVLLDGVHYYATQTSGGCESILSLDVLIDLDSIELVFVSKTIPNCGQINGSIVVDAMYGMGTYNYSWSNGTSESTLAGIGSGDYTVTVIDSLGCTDQLIINIDCKKGIPEIITNNGNGKNDTWILGLDTKAQVQIYNRWGSLVYTALPYLDDWDGKSNEGGALGKEYLPSGTYFYIIDYNNGEKPVSGYIEFIK